MAVLSRWFTVLPLREAAARLRGGTLPVRSACVTFDDGYADNVTVALPILQRYGVSATFFVATGFIDGGRMWNDSVIGTVRGAQGDTLDARCVGLDKLSISNIGLRRQAIERLLAALKYLPLEERQKRVDQLAAETSASLPSDLMMTADQVRHLCASGMGIGAHTVTHPILAELGPERAECEIRDSKRRLEAITGSPVAVFAYPNGTPGRDYRREHVGMVRELGGGGLHGLGRCARGERRVSVASIHSLGPDPGQVRSAATSQYLPDETRPSLSAGASASFEFNGEGLDSYPRLSGFICGSKALPATPLCSSPLATISSGLTCAPSFDSRVLISFSTSTRVRTSAISSSYGRSK